MEAVKYTICEQCRGTGQNNKRTCSVCFSHGHFYFVNNNFLYWGKDIGYLHIFIRELKQVIDIIINSFLIIVVLLTLLLLFIILNTVRSDPRNFLDYFLTGQRYGFFLWLAVLLDMFLYYRLTIPVMRARKKIALLHDKNTYTKHDLSDSLSQEASNIIDKAWLYGRHKGIFPVSVWHLLFILLNDKDIRLVLARLGVGADNLKQTIDDNLAKLVGPEEKNSGLSLILQTVILNAYLHMVERQAQKITEVDLLTGLVLASQEIKNFFYDFNIDEEKINNVIAWIEINKQLAQQYRRFRARSSFKPKSGINRSYTAIATPVLDSFSQDLTALAKAGYLALTIAREKEINEIITTVESDASSVVLVGPAGIGKGRIIDGLANSMMAEDVPELFQDKRLVSISLPLLISGATGTGKLEERFLAILQETAISGNIILYIENVHQLVGVSSEGNAGVDLSEVLASEIRKRNFIVLATTTNEDYVKYLEGKALGEVLKKVTIAEPDKNQTIKIMEAHVGAVENKYKIYFTYVALEEIYHLSDRYMPDRALPTKAIDLMDEVAIMVAKTNRRDKLIRKEDVAKLVSHKTNIPLTQVTTQESDKLLNLEEEIHSRVVGQHEAVKYVVAALRRARSELRDIKRPIASLLFLGPTGVGKTELAKTVAEKYFGDENDMIRLDMSEFQNQSSLPNLLGSSEIGRPGLLTEAVRHKPFALLLLDEIEKAHPDILNIFLQVMEDGRLTDALGRTVDFTNLIIVATSNAGTAYIQDQIKAGRDIEDFRDHLVKEELRDIFRPEFINRFDGVVVFRPLSQEEIFQIAGLMLKGVAKRLETKGVFFEYTEAAQRELAQAGFDPIFGARPLRRLIQERVDNTLANFLLTGKISRRDVIVYNAGGQIEVKKAKGY
jgi:ATP-dependent Clp protease ATP-binding subunit ClpC